MPHTLTLKSHLNSLNFDSAFRAVLEIALVKQAQIERMKRFIEPLLKADSDIFVHVIVRDEGESARTAISAFKSDPERCPMAKFADNYLGSMENV